MNCKVSSYKAFGEDASSSLIFSFLTDDLSEDFVPASLWNMRRQRVLLRDVSAEAVQAFLHYLYAADTVLTPQLAPDLCSLAQRSGLFFPLTSRFLTVTDRDYLVDGP